ncbi:MAG: hypothetical protein WD907_05750 [Bacilli bacterium]
MSNRYKFPTDEELHNMDEEEKEEFVENYYNGVYAEQGYKPTFKEEMKHKYGKVIMTILGLVAIAIVYGLINLVLVGGQNLWHSGDKSKFEEIESELAYDKNQIQNIEQRLSAMISQLDALEQDIDGTNDESEYNNLVEQYNSDLVNYNSKKRLKKQMN